MKKISSLILLMFVCMSISVSAHPGSLDENGGHYNRKTGEYHYHDGTHTSSGVSNSSSSKIEYDNIIFEDKVSGIKFLVPENWNQQTLVNNSQSLKVQFSVSDSKFSICYQSLLEPVALQKQEVAEAYNLHVREIITRRYNGIDFFSFSIYQNGKWYYQVIAYTDGYMISFLQHPDNNKLSSELHAILSSFVVSNSTITPHEEPTIASTKDTLPTQSYSSEDTNLKNNDSNNFINIYHIVIAAIIFLIALPFIKWLFKFLYDIFKENPFPNYNLKNYKQTLDSTTNCLSDIQYSKKIINDFNNMIIPDRFEIGSDNLPKDKGETGWGRTFTVYKTKYGLKLHADYGCCKATIKCHIFKAYELSPDPYDSLCKICAWHYCFPDTGWIISAKDYYKAANNLTTRQNELHLLLQKLLFYSNRCNRKYMKFLLFFNKDLRNQLKDLNILRSNLYQSLNST